MVKKEKDRYFSYYKETKFLKYKQFYMERDLIRIASEVFEREKELKKTGRVNNFSIKISKHTFKIVNINKISKILEELFLLILLEDVKISIEMIDDDEKRKRKKYVSDKRDAITLFSGGIDSYSGIKTIETKIGNAEGVFVAHNDQHRIINIVESMKKSIKSNIRTLYAPGMGSTGYSQIRGFLYILYSSIFTNICNTKKIYVTECGPTMYQPLFSPFDSITYTTHPYVLKAAKDILHLFLGTSIKIFIPYENLTKAELIINSGIRDYSMTHSCISQRFGDHDGTCFGCVVRKLACLVSGVKDTQYRTDIFSSTASQDNLICLLDYSINILEHYNSMPAFQIDKIEEFNKKDLFCRYALDNLAGLMLAVNRTHPLYKKYVLKKERILKQRIAKVRANIKKPDFNKTV
jgi:hypothetical protein